MRHLLTVLLAAFALFVVTPASVSAQQNRPLTKAEQKRLKKEWKKRAKEYIRNPIALRDNQEGFKKKVEDLTRENNLLSEQYRDAQLELDKLRAEVERLKGENGELRTAYEAQKANNEKGVTPGLVFKVQIGAFRHFDMSRYLAETQNFEGESADNLNRYTLGSFRDLSMAEAFQKDIKKMGIRDAWIVPYRDGVRIEMKEAKRILSGEGAAPAPAENGN